jgi:hypothetical protein
MVKVLSTARPIGRDYVIDGLCKVVFDRINYYMAYCTPILERLKYYRRLKNAS